MALAARHRPSGYTRAAAQRNFARRIGSFGWRAGLYGHTLVFLVWSGPDYYGLDFLGVGALFFAQGSGRLQHGFFAYCFGALGRQACIGWRGYLCIADYLQSSCFRLGWRHGRRRSVCFGKLCTGSAYPATQCRIGRNYHTRPGHKAQAANFGEWPARVQH